MSSPAGWGWDNLFDWAGSGYWAISLVLNSVLAGAVCSVGAQDRQPGLLYSHILLTLTVQLMEMFVIMRARMSYGMLWLVSVPAVSRE